MSQIAIPAWRLGCLCIGLLVAGLPGAAQAQQPSSMPEAVELTIRAVAGLQYDQLRFAVPPGARVTLRFENADEMAHNLVITASGAREAVVAAALGLGAAGPEVDYVPDRPDVLWATPLLEPEGNATLTFTAPSEPGVYPYVCTFPGHGNVMYGAMYVTTEDLPPLEEDPNVPPRDLIAEARTPHPFPLEYPAVYRTFMPDAGPAAIAVGLEGDLSYCWDAGPSMLRYAWTGGFIDQTAHWSGNGSKLAEVVGEVFYRNQTGFPLRIGTPETTPTPRFKGYRLVGRIPEFHYRADGLDVRERIEAAADGVSLARTFQVEGATDTIWFATAPDDGVVYEASAGTWEGPWLKLTPEEARRFTLTMTAAVLP